MRIARHQTFLQPFQFRPDLLIGYLHGRFAILAFQTPNVEMCPSYGLEMRHERGVHNSAAQGSDYWNGLRGRLLGNDNSKA